MSFDMFQMPAPLVLTPTNGEDYPADWLLVGIWENAALPANINSRLGGVLTRLKESGDLTGRALELVPILTPTGIPAKRVLVVGLGSFVDANRQRFVDAAAVATRYATGRKWDRIGFLLPSDLTGPRRDAAVLGTTTGLMQGSTGPGIRKSELTRHMPGELAVLLSGSETPPAEAIWKRARTEARAVSLARELVNLPPCDLYPETFAQRVQENASEFNIECTIWDESMLKAERMNAILGVARGSERPPRLAILRYRHAPSSKTLAIVGKGVTFDSGGLSLKTNEQMLDMKCDMAGAAAAFAATLAIADLRLPINLITLMPLVENMPGGRALKLGDVLKSRSGKTIEILNTDAEGRVILADALAYAVEQKATHIVDLATLTGACLVALGSEVAGLMSNHNEWSDSVRLASKESGEKVWPLPMDAHYGDFLHSAVADLKNAPGTRYGGAITAAKFLEQFVGSTAWAHLDIAGPAWAERDCATRDSGGTGFGVRLLVELAHRFQ